jgi:anthranilate phosphoribosyltransferase
MNESEMREVLNYLFENNVLRRDEARRILLGIAGGKYSPLQVSSFLTVYRMRHITVDELEGFRDAMLELCIPIDLSAYNPVDLCGTGGDHKNTFNISTIASFVVAGAGVNVAKHGNYGVSSICGSSNVLEYLGVKFTNDKDLIHRKLETAGICFLHAPLFHPAMKQVAPVRKELGLITFFNMLGPMVNPSFPQNQIVGVYNLELARLYAYLYQKSSKKYYIVHSMDGYDEISLTSFFKLISPKGEKIHEPEDWGFSIVKPEALFGGDSIQESADIFMRILKADGTNEQNDVVKANAALAIHCVKNTLSIQDCLLMAEESLLSGKALTAFNKFIGN